MQTLFDVVVVPDFSGAQSPVFEARTLFFLASWIEYAGAARAFPLHLACIGQPPNSVRRLAEKAGAEISLHAPLGAESRGTSNKLRGLEVERRAPGVLLLDADVLVLGDLSELAQMENCVAAAPENNPRVPQRYWERIYPALGMELPRERIPSMKGELGLPRLRNKKLASDQDNMHSMLPYYNSGIILAPWHCDLRARWEENIRRVAALFEEEEAQREESWKSVRASDQAGLAVTIEQFKREGVPFQRLPDRFHAHLLHLYRRTVPLDEARLFHIFRMFKDVSASDNFSAEINNLQRELLAQLRYEALQHDRKYSRVAALRRCWLPAMLDVRRLCARLRILNERHVQKVLS
jgi:hypothetical protein